MAKKIFLVVLMAVALQIAAWPVFLREADARTEVTVTFAAGGIACGVYFFIAFTVHGYSLLNYGENTALLNYTDQGWEVGLPAVTMLQTNGWRLPVNLMPPIDSRAADARTTAAGMTHVDLVGFRF